MLQRGLPSLAEWGRLSSSFLGDGLSDARRALLAMRSSAMLAGRTMRMETLLRIPTGPALGRRGALHLAQVILFRTLLHARRGPVPPEVMDGLRRLLIAAGEPGTPQVTAIEEWSREVMGAAADATPPTEPEEARTSRYVDALERLGRVTGFLRPAVVAARLALSPSLPGSPYLVRLVTCLEPVVHDAFLLPGLLLEGEVELSGTARDGDLEPVPDLAGSAQTARSMVEGREQQGVFHASVRLPSPAGDPADARLPFEGRSGGLALLAAFHFALGHRNHLPPVVAFTGALDEGHVRHVAGLGRKVEVAAASGVRLLVAPEESFDRLDEGERAAIDACGVRVLRVPSSRRFGRVIEWLEEALSAEFPTLLCYRPERLFFFLARADGQVRTGGRAEPRAELRFLERVTGAGDSSTERNIHAVALAGIGRSYSHEADAETALEYLDRAHDELETLASERRLDAVALPTWLDLDNLRAVSLIDILRHDEAVRILRENARRKRELGPVCAARSLGATLGTLGQALTYLAAGKPAYYAEAEACLQEALTLVEPFERPRDRVYLATALGRGGRTAEALELLHAVIAETAHATECELVNSRLFASLRLLETYARSQSDDDATAGLAWLEANPVDDPEDWRRAMRTKWEAVLRARTGAPWDEVVRLFDLARSGVTPPAGASRLHGDQVLLASCDLEEARIQTEQGDFETAAMLLSKSRDRLAPFVRFAEAEAVRALLAAAGEASADRGGSAVETASEPLSRLIPY